MNSSIFVISCVLLVGCGYREVSNELLKERDVERKQQSTGKDVTKTDGSR